MRRSLYFVAGLALAASAHAAGPDTIARSDRALWPDPTSTGAGFDRASRAELLAFGRQLADTQALTDDGWRARLHLKDIDAAHLAKMRNVYWERIAHNYNLASAHCTADEPLCAPAKDTAAFKALAAQFTIAADQPYAAWYANAATFHRIYLDELLRLAALFPRISSEVDTFNANEFTGSELPDRQFFLTFDDGPSAAGGSTEKLLAALKTVHLDGTFFVLGGNLETRAKAGDVAALYAGQCVALHGWEHKSHAGWADWQASVEKTDALVRDRLAAQRLPLFRPPYGQRKADSEAYFAGRQLKVALWNIDSQDWNAGLSAKDSGERVLALMLLWRHGVILFHDVHLKAPTAVPYLVAQTGDGAVQWRACRELGAP